MEILDGNGGTTSEEEAAYRFLSSEPTLHAFSPERVEDAQRLSFQAEESGVVYSLTVSGEALNNPGVIATVAGQWAHTWNVNAAVPGVDDIAETQEVRALGSLEDVAQVAVKSTSGRSTSIITLEQRDVRPDVFAERVAAERLALDRIERGS